MITIHFLNGSLECIKIGLGVLCKIINLKQVKDLCVLKKNYSTKLAQKLKNQA